jgi:hypothetical protein
MRHAGLLFTVCVVASGGVAAQDSESARMDYLQAVAAFYRLPASEVAILDDWELPLDEIPVVLFVARRAGVSPEALVALRGSGRSWASLTDRYRVTTATLHLPLPDDASAGALADAYATFREMPVDGWQAIRLTDTDIVSLVNIRVIGQSLGLSS